MPTRPLIPRGCRRARGVCAATLAATLTFCSGLSVAKHASWAPEASGPSTGADAFVAAGVTLAAGRTPGSFGVTHSGAASYRIPLWTPPGVGDVELDLALLYNSRAGNGTLGVGWTLSGLSMISRCSGTVAQDGAAGGVTLTTADRYCLDGRQLKLVSGVYGAAGSVYATEIETFSRVVANGVSGAGPESFTVTSRNGLVYEYGGTPDSRINAGAANPTVRTWAMSRVRDRAGGATGNSIALSYANDAQAAAYTHGTFRIATITYPTTASGAGPFYEVRFGYSPRPASDVPVGYLAGSVLREPNKLDTIAVHSVGSAAPIKSYHLAYDVSPATGRLRLTSLQECAATSCFRPTQVSHQSGASGWQSLRETGASAASAEPPLVADFNGDGLTDLLFPVSAGSGKLAWSIALATLSGFAAPFATGLVTTSTTSTVLSGDFVGNGRTQFLIQQNGVWHVAGYVGGGFSIRGTNLVADGEYGAADFDGDGLADLVGVTNTTPKTITVRRNTTSPAANSLVASFAPATQTVWSVPSTRILKGWKNPRTPDLDGDGRADLAMLTTNQSERAPRYFLRPLLSNGFGPGFTLGAEREIDLLSLVATADWNADGCSDVLQVRTVLVSDCAGGFKDVVTAPTRATGDGPHTVLPADWNGDGRTDLLYVDYYTNTWHVIPSTGEGAGAPVTTDVAAPAGSAWFVHDSDGDGLTDLGMRASDGKLRYRPSAAATLPPDLVTTFTDAFGVRHQPTYVSMARSHHVRDSTAQFPEADLQAPLYVVSEFLASDGAGGTYRQRLSYAGARRHLQGRGFLGFGSRRSVDERSGLVTLDYVERSFPFTGTHVRRDVLRGDGVTPVSLWQATLQHQTLGTAGDQQRSFPFVSYSSHRAYEVGGALNGTLTTETTTSYTYGDSYGNPTRIETTVTDRDPTSPYSGTAWRSTAAYKYVNDAASWCLGLPSSSNVTSTAAGQAAMVRKANFVADTNACRITRQVLEPGTALKVTTNYGYDACGNLNLIGVIGVGPDGLTLPARRTTFGYGSRCQLPETVTNALGQTTQIQYQYDFGTPVRSVDPNGLATTWGHDEYGRRTLEIQPDQTRRTWSYESCGPTSCWGPGDLRFVVYESRLATDGTLVRSRNFAYDGLERLRFEHFDRAPGAWTAVERRYDALGRHVYVSRPYSAAANGYTAVAYDPIGRILEASEYDGAGAFVRSTGITYAGRTVSVRDPLGRSRNEVRDVAGRLRQVKDPSAARPTSYDYDSHGNLTRIEDARAAVSSGQYNVRGFRVRWNDVAAGSWTYTPNSLNELVAWTDAKGQAFSASHDLLGRLTSRTEPEGSSTFKWGTSAAARNVGRLVSKVGPGYGESYTYDASGRVASRTIVSDQTYQYDYSYNPIGELDTLTYPASPVPAGQTQARLKLRYGYSFGEPAQIDDVTTSPGRTLWRLQEANDDRMPTLETVANGAAVVASSYDRATAMPLSRASGTSSNPSLHQDLRYEWDVADNLKQRRDAKQGRSETFQYDQLNRLTGSTLDDVTDFSVAYDVDGSILHKSDVGAYVYGDAARPHRLTAAGTETFAYDANGNVTSRGGLAQQWASFNLPTLVRRSGYQAQFAYGPDHERVQQVATYSNGIETTQYVGGLLEKESTTSTGLTYWRHYVPTPGGSTVVISRNSDGSTTTRYVLPDHLGSSDTLLDGSGALVARLSFDAHGNRRGSDWRRSTSPDWTGIADTTRQGYTGHEMVDNVGLVHMGGRVYDPRLGRFLSVDPLIGDLLDSQSVHPYAYAGNRPLNTIDASGLVADGPCMGMCISLVAGAVQTAFNFLFGGSDEAWIPNATAIPGPSAQGGTDICGPGSYSPSCTGMVLYAGAPGVGGGPGTSSWVNSSVEDPYAQENLEQFFLDLGLNAIDVLILSPVYGVRDGYQAAQRGEHLQAVVILSLTACEVAKPCYALKGPLKAITTLSKSTRHVLPREVARVVAGDRKLTTLGRPGTEDVFVVDADDISGLNAKELARRLTIPPSEKFTIIRFPTPEVGLASPVLRTNPGFVPGGRTRGGAREYIIPNGPVPGDAKVEVIQ